MADAGWGAVSWPKDVGGRGATVLEQLVFAEETTRARAPLPLNVIGINNIAPAIMEYGTDAAEAPAPAPHGARRRHLVPGHVRTGGGLRPRVAAHPRGPRRHGDDADFVVNGQKIWTSLGHRADWCQLYVRTDPEAPKHKGISCLIVDMTLARHRGPPPGHAQRRRPTSPRCSSTTFACLPTPCSVRSTADGEWPPRR